MLDGADVVFADVEERAYVKGHVAHAPDLERLAGRLHDEMRDTAVIRVLEVLIQLQHLRRRDVRLLADDAVIGVDGGDQRAVGLAGAGEHVVEDIAHIVRRGALALGAGDANGDQLVRHIVIIEPSQYHQRVADVADNQPRRVYIVGVVGDIGDRALGQCVAQIRHLEMRALAEKQRRAGYCAVVVAEAVDGFPRQCAVDRTLGQQPRALQRVDIFLQCVESSHKNAPFSSIIIGVYHPPPTLTRN